MLNKEKHQLLMGSILRGIYSDVGISSLVGLKGGTCAYFFYNLPRFSVDLDFDLFVTDEATKKAVFEKVGAILKKYGEIKTSHIKKNTIFFLLSYGDKDHNIKLEISTRDILPNLRDCFEAKEHLGIGMLTAKMDYLFAGKLVALVLRSSTAMRDIFDVRYFAENKWDINAVAVKALTGKSVRDHLIDCVSVVEGVKDGEILFGLGEMIDEKQKAWVRNNLKKEAIFQLKLYASVIK